MDDVPNRSAASSAALIVCCFDCVHATNTLPLSNCRLAAQLARTEEAAKRALIRADQGAKGSTAQQLLDAQRQIQQLHADNSDLSMKLAR